ncbi:MAG: glycosyltransferase [Planctomycetota bacterium]
MSVLLPVYNAGSYLDEALRSIRRQTLEDWELVVVNDGSTDESQLVIDRHAREEPRIRPLQQPNGGLVSALNRGLVSCRGGLIARMDADDVALPDRFERQVRVMEERPEWVAVGGAAVLIDEDGQPVGQSQNPVGPEAVHAKLMSGGYALLHPTMMIRGEVLERIGGYDAQYQSSEDLDLLLRLDAEGPMGNLAEPVLKYRQSGGSMSKRLHSRYPYFDWRALSAARRRGRPVTRWSLAASADRVSWSAVRRGDRREAFRFAWRAWLTRPWGYVGYRSLLRCIFGRELEGR